MERVNPEQIGFSLERLDRIQPAMQRYLDDGKLAGMQCMIARCGKLAYFECFGKRDLAADLPMTPDTIFRIYSMSKPITSTAIMMLLEEGRLRLNDPVYRFIPELKGLKVITGNTESGLQLAKAQREITIRDLLTHTAGFSYGFDPDDELDKLYRKKFWGKLERKKEPTLKDFVGLLANLPLAHQPGTVFHYSVGIDVLGYIVEVVSGLSFDAFLQKRIFKPLGMVDTTFWTPSEKAERLAHMYGPDEKQPGQLKDIDPHEKSQYTHPVSLFSGGGGLVSTAADYLRFCQMILNYGELDGARLLGRKTVEMMTMNHLPEGVYEDANHAYGFGLGGYVTLNVAQSHMLGSNGNWGWGGAANTKFWVDFKEQMIGILMLQFMPGDLYPIEQDFVDLTYQALVN